MDVSPIPSSRPLLVILTKVRIQGYGRRPARLWILTFVRMTDGSGRMADMVSGARPTTSPRPPARLSPATDTA